MASDVTVDMKGGEFPLLCSEKRLTKVQQAKLEALAAFGNCTFDSLVVKRESFKSKLSATAETPATTKESVKRLTRMEKARQEANEAFKNIRLGQKRKTSVSENKTETRVPVTAKRRLTRLERCKLEAQQAFGNVPLGTVTENVAKKDDQNKVERHRSSSGTKCSGLENKETTQKNTKRSFDKRSLERNMKEKKKSLNKGRQNRRSSSLRRRSSATVRRRSSAKSNRLTKVQASQLEAFHSFGGLSLEKLCSSSKEASEAEVKGEPMTDDCETVEEGEVQSEVKEPVAMVKHDKSDPSQKDTVFSEMNVEPALIANAVYVVREMSLQKCDPVDKVTNSQVIPSDCCNTEVQTEEVRACANHVIAVKGMHSILEESLPEVPTQERSITTVAASKPLTRLERARLEALQSFNGQAFDHVIKTSTRKMARYLTPVKHQGTNTELHLTRNTPCQTDDSLVRHYPPPNKSFYSSLQGNSFHDRDTLLESSKKVVQTARSLDTPSPECSPASL